MRTRKMRSRIARAQAAVVILTLMASLFGAFAQEAKADPTELFFSEYVEGSSNNKALEIYNGTGAAVDLAAGGYTIEIYFNGSTTPGTTVSLSGTVGNGDVYIVADNDASSAILAEADLTSTSNFFNGNDAIALLKNDVIIDVIGQIGFDPGSYWGSGDVTTVNHTLRRKETVEAGDTNGGDVFDPAAEWDGYPVDTFDGLGSHTVIALDYTPIYDIQYTADPSGDSSYAGQADVTTEGIVTAVFDYGYFIEDPAGGAWSGLYVYDTTNDPAVGDRVRLTGTVSEYYYLTELGYLTSFAVETSGNPLPDPVILNTGDVSQEQYEGVLVRVESVTVTDDDLGNGEWSVSDGSGDVVIDDKGSYTYTPTTGDAIDAIVGPLDFTYSAFKIQPRDDGDIVFGLDYTPVYDIQYTTDPLGNSPYAGQSGVTTEGIVTAVFYNGYFIEDPAGGAWNGLFVYDSSTPALGDRVRLTGTVSEYYNLTQLGSLSSFAVETSGNALPDPMVLATGDVSQEQWEGVLVRVENVTVTDDDLGYGEWSVSDGSGDVVIDDKGSYTYAATTGDAIDAIVGPLDFTHGAFKILPRDDGDIFLPTAPAFVINEIHADPASDLTGDANGDGIRDSGADEFVELVNNSDTDLDISGWTLADSVEVRHVFPAGTVVPAHCAVVVFGGGSPTGVFGGAVVQTASTGLLGLNNGGDTVVLSDGMVDQATVSYGSEGGDNQSLTLDPDITGTWFVKHSLATGSGEALFSPGTMIDGSSFTGCFACGDPATFIHDVQGSGSTSPLYGASGIIIEGVVVGDFQDMSTGLGGFFLQEEDGDVDGDPASSEGVFVYDYGFMDVNVGDVVRVKGNVTEYYSLTELNSVSEMAVCPYSATATAAEITLPVDSLDRWEEIEGMLVTIPQTLYASGNYDLGHYGEVDLSVGGRLSNPTNIVAPGAPAIALQDLNDRSRIQLDDGSNVQNPPVVPYLGTDNTLRAGDTIPELTGVVGYAFGVYEIHPTEPVDFTRVNVRDLVPDSVGGVAKVASLNVLNYFTTIDTGAWICGPAGDMECRGADSVEEFTRQRDKIISAIVAMDADVVGLIEIENPRLDDPTDDALLDLVSGLNDVAGAGTYAFIDTGTIGTDAIKQAFVYKPGTVEPVGSYAILDASVDPTFIDTLNRPALAQTFQHTTGEIFTVVVNHLKSKGSDCNDVGDPDIGDGQGNCNLTRTAAATALANWLATDPTGSGDPDFLIIGDLNAYALEDPVTAIKDAGYTNLIESFIGSDAYSYVYYGQAGYLDHALSTSSLAARVEGVSEWHINADEPSALNYNDYNQPYLYNPDPFSSSDHDPVIVGLCDAIPPVVNVKVTPDVLWPPNHKYVNVEALVEVFDPTGGVTVSLLSVESNEADNGLGDGDTPNDIVILNDFSFKLRAEVSGLNGDRVYTVTYLVTDGCGNSTVATAPVTVPHDQRIVKKLLWFRPR